MTTDLAPDNTLSRAERQRLQLRQDIIEASFAEFSERGYHQTAIADIAKRLGIGHGTFYRHFKNKRDILEHVIDDVYTRIATILLDDNAAGTVDCLEDYRAQAQRIGVALTKLMIETPGMIRLVLFESTSIDPDMTARIMGFFDWAAEQVTSYMEHGVKLGFFREDLDVQATGHVVVGMIITTALTFLRTADEENMQERINEAVMRILVDGIAKH